MQEKQKAFFFEFQVLHFNHLAGFYKHHGAVVVVVPRSAVQDHTCFQLLKADHIEIAGKLSVAYRAGFVALVEAEQGMFRWRKAIVAMQGGECLVMFHIRIRLNKVN